MQSSAWNAGGGEPASNPVSGAPFEAGDSRPATTTTDVRSARDASRSGLAEPGSARKDRRAGASALVVLALVLLALLLRGVGARTGLPAGIEDDAGVLVRQIEMVRDGTPPDERDETWRLYPHLIAELAGRFAPEDFPRAQDDTQAELLERAARTPLFARWSVLVLALGAIPLVYLVARRFLSRPSSTLAAALVSTSLLFQCFSQQARPHAPAAAFVLLALHACLVLVERGTFVAYLWAGVASGLALGTLQSNALVAAPLFLACLHAGRARAGYAPRPALRTVGTVAAFALVALCWAVFYPPGDHNVGAGLLEFLPEDRALIFFGHTVYLAEFQGRGFATVLWSLWSFEPLACVLALAGLATWFFRARGAGHARPSVRDPRLLLLAVYGVLHLVAIGMYARTYERFCLQLVPLLAILAASGAQRLAARVPRSSIAIAAAWIVFGVVPAVRLAVVRARVAPQDEAGALLAESARADDLILLHPLVDLPLLRTKEALAIEPLKLKIPWRGYTPWRRSQDRLGSGNPAVRRYNLRPMLLQREGYRGAFQKDPVHWLADSGARFVVLPLQAIREGPELFHSLRRACAERGELAARFPASADGETDVVLGFEDRAESARPHWTWSLLVRSPVSVEVIEVWKLR